MPDMIALKSLPYAGKRLEAGERFDAGQRDARILFAIKKARYATEDDSPTADNRQVETRALVAGTENTASSVKRTYRRRDIATSPESKSAKGAAPRARRRGNGAGTGAT